MTEAQVDHEHEMDWRVTQLQARVTELLEANDRYVDRARKAEAERDEARAALEPFAKVEPFDVVDGVWSHRGDGSAQILTEDDFKRARATAGVK